MHVKSGDSILERQRTGDLEDGNYDAFGQVHVYRLGYRLTSGEFNPRWLLDPCPAGVRCW